MIRWNPTPEQRRQSVQKGIATRRANKAAREAALLEDMSSVDNLKLQIVQLEQRLDCLKGHEQLFIAAQSLTNKTLLSHEQIVNGAMKWDGFCGVYFLVKNRQVVYVGQSKNVFSRITKHTDKDFDSVACVPCLAESLDVLESLYIHLLQPTLNGSTTGKRPMKLAPLRIDEILKKMALHEGRAGKGGK